MNTLHPARANRVLAEFDHSAAFEKAVGPIKINAKLADEVSFSRCRRMNKDAEIQSLCLLIYWLQNVDMTAVGSDLISEYMHGGLDPVLRRPCFG